MAMALPRTRKWLLLVVALMMSAGTTAVAQSGSRVRITDLIDKPDDWFKTDEGTRVVSNIIALQTVHGGWHKNYDATLPLEQLVPKKRENEKRNPQVPQSDGPGAWDRTATIDNNATYSELRILARAVRVTGNDKAKASFDRGVAFLLKCQYENGGFPQRYPLEDNYGREITYNDNAMVGALNLLRDVAEGEGDFSFTTPEQRAGSKVAVERGLRCILKTQYRQKDGTLTLWGQQHDEKTYLPSKARSYELPSLVSAESAGLVLFLMDTKDPSPEVVAAVEAAVAYFERSKILGMEYQRLRGPEYEKGEDRKLVPNPSAPPVWSRFYVLDSDPPKSMFTDRQGNIHDTLDAVPHERRLGYAWYSTAPNRVLDRYGKWKASIKK